MMLAQSPMASWLVLVVCIATLSALPKSHGKKQAALAPTGNILCGGYNMRIFTQPATFSDSVSQCKSIGMKILRHKAHKLRKRYPCFINIAKFLLDRNISDIWLLNPYRLNNSDGTLHLDTGLVTTTSYQSETATQPFICAKDRNECEDPTTTCQPGTYCRNVKRGYDCQPCGHGNDAGRRQVDAESGLVTCQVGFHWTCSNGPCPRISAEPAQP
eukprot:scpid101017/ scgid33988/ 